MWSSEISCSFAWVILFLCIFIWLKWIPPTGSILAWIPTRNPTSPAKVSEKSDGIQLEQTGGRTLSTATDTLSGEEGRVQTSTTYDEDWIKSPQIFSLEQRSIFSKTWLYAIHRSRFTKPGDYHTLTLATFSIFLILGRDQKIRAFHNVCRHRAFTITKKASGSSLVLGCRYHGWSYNARGELMKAPEFDRVPGFDKKQNSLFEIRTKVVSTGCVFVNFDASDEVQDFDNMELGIMESWKIGGCNWISGWNLDGNFNWKILDVEDGPELEYEAGTVTRKWSSLLPLFQKRAYQKALHLFPGMEFYLSPSGKTWISVRYIPQTATRTTMQLDLYTSLPKDDQSNRILESLLKAYFQDRIRHFEEMQATFVRNDIPNKNLVKHDAIHSLLIAHSKLEKVRGQEIHPAFRTEAFSKTGQLDDDLCKELEGRKFEIQDGCLPSTDLKKSFEW